MEVINVTDTDFRKIIEENENVVVKYYADWCGSCRLFAPKFKRLANDHRFQSITFIDVNAEKNPDARKAAGVTNLPFFAIFKKGKLLEGTATSKEEVVTAMLQKLLI